MPRPLLDPHGRFAGPIEKKHWREIHPREVGVSKFVRLPDGVPVRVTFLTEDPEDATHPRYGKPCWDFPVLHEGEARVLSVTAMSLVFQINKATPSGLKGATLEITRHGTGLQTRYDVAVVCSKEPLEEQREDKAKSPENSIAKSIQSNAPKVEAEPNCSLGSATYAVLKGVNSVDKWGFRPSNRVDSTVPRGNSPPLPPPPERNSETGPLTALQLEHLGDGLPVLGCQEPFLQDLGNKFPDFHPAFCRQHPERVVKVLVNLSAYVAHPPLLVGMSYKSYGLLAPLPAIDTFKCAECYVC